ncbi:2-octaprenyl-3-methyl-6-methoxy-1,4-benzoquinol hydroxylase, partial [Acinetobacter towneri]|nr:2-octaprenyl-3-methyl-6-methoxy-1,4-benzoquinol hydroxylase [Acinetobacter towneri]
MVGSALALALQSLPLKIVLLDGSSLSAQPLDFQRAFAPRVSALSLASERILARLQAWSGVQQRRACPYYQMEVWDGDGTGNIQFSAADVHAEHLGHIVENDLVQDALLEQLANSPIQLLAHSRLEQLTRSQNGWQLSLSDQSQLTTPLLTAADGANSAVRRLTQAPTREWDYLHHAIVTSVQTEQPHQHTAWQRFTATGPI